MISRGTNTHPQERVEEDEFVILDRACDGDDLHDDVERALHALLVVAMEEPVHLRFGGERDDEAELERDGHFALHVECCLEHLALQVRDVTSELLKLWPVRLEPFRACGGKHGAVSGARDCCPLCGEVVYAEQEQQAARPQIDEVCFCEHGIV